MKHLIIGFLCLGLAACGGGFSNKNDMAANACDVFAKSKLGDKLYTLDKKVLAASMKDNGETSKLMAPIIIEPGLVSEVKQTLDCDVRFSADGSSAEVINAIFIW
jgi:hypothetical protein